MDIIKPPVDIKTLIQTSTIQIYDKNKLIDKLKEHFSEEEQKLYVANLFLYLNYHPVNDFVVNLENVWKFIGFSNKANGKRLLKQHFTENKDYKKLLIRSDENKSLLIRTDEQKIKDPRGGYNEETIMLNINTFKKLCLKANTNNADKIHDYYIKLEMIYNELTKEQLEEQQKLIEENEKLLLEKNKKLEFYENKPSTHGFSARRKGFVYIIKERSKPGHYKIGMSFNVDRRLRNLNTGSSEASLQIYHEIQTYDCEMLESIVHKILQPFNIIGRREWFFFDDSQIEYALYILHEINEFLKEFDIKSSEEFTEKIIRNFLNPFKPEIKQDTNEEFRQDTNEKIKETNIYKLTGQRLRNKTGVYKGVNWCTEKQKWRSELKFSYKNYCLGYYSSELDGAKAYNDYALYINNEYNTNYSLNQIDNYIPNPRNIPEETLKTISELKSSKYNGVSYDSKRNYYVVSIKYKNKTYHLGNNESEIECAKLYNQQALYHNKNDNTNYVLNEITDYITIPCNIHDSLQKEKINKKSSKYIGVTLNKKTGKYKAVFVYNKKQIHIGTFINEHQAAEAYNIRVSEFNEKFNTSYKLNTFII